jgi:hypothetical protein
MMLAGLLCALPMTATVLAAMPATRSPVTPGLVNYQGRLLTPSGGVYTDGVYTVEFRIYTTDTGGSNLWGGAYSVYVKDGYMNVVLGAPGGTSLTNAPLPGYAPADLWKALWYDEDNPATANDRYLGVKVVAGPAQTPSIPAVEAFPRQRLLSVPFAERAQLSQYARSSMKEFVVGTTLTASGMVTAVAGMVVQGSATLPATTINGSATLNQGVTVNNQPATLNKGLAVGGGTAYLNAGVDVTGGAVFRGGVNASNSKIQENGADLIPRGVIVMWNGSSPPAGWALCDGQNGTPDLRNRFVLGYDNINRSNAVRDTGGEAQHTLSWNEMPVHNHSTTFSQDGWPDGSGDRDYHHYIMYPGRGGNEAFYTTSAGSGWAHNNMPPYYVLAFIMKL